MAKEFSKRSLNVEIRKSEIYKLKNSMQSGILHIPVYTFLPAMQ